MHNYYKLTDGDYFLFVKDVGTWKKDSLEWKKRKDGNILESYTTLKQINCIYYTSDNDKFKKRCYYLLRDPTYILIHYRNEEEENKQHNLNIPKNKNFNFVGKKRIQNNSNHSNAPEHLNYNNHNFIYPINDSNQDLKRISSNKSSTITAIPIDFNSLHKHINIIDFAPNSVLVNTTSKILIIIESYLNFFNLKMLESQIRIKFSDDIFMPCTVLNASTLSSIIPYGQPKEVTLEIFIGKDSVSTCNPNLKLKYIEATNLINKNTFIGTKDNHMQTSNFGTQSKEAKKDAMIFQLSDEVIKKKFCQIFNELKSLIIFYNMGKTSIRNVNTFTTSTNVLDSQITYDETSLHKEMENMLDELEEIEKNGGTSRLNIIYKQDDSGYDIIHYISAMDYSSLLDLFAKHNIKLCEVSRDKLTPYEIAAGKWKVHALSKLIELIDKRDNEDILNTSENISEDNLIMISLNLENSNEKEKIFYNMDILRSAFNLALDFADKNKINPNGNGNGNNNNNNKFINSGDMNVIELLLKQIRIQLAVNSTSDHIISAINKNIKKSDSYFKNENSTLKLYSNEENDNIMMIQKYIRGWLRRSHYNGMKSVVNKLKERCKFLFEGKEKFCNFKTAIVKIQKKFRRWMKNKTEITSD